MYRSSMNAPSRATSTTRCQKCLKYGHYSYECKATVEQRPYTSRPSRMQQLMNPNLRPKLSEENADASVRREGLADEIIGANEAERARQRSRSVSSSDSVSTVSTNKSRTPSLPPKRRRIDNEEHDKEASRAKKQRDFDSRRQRRSVSSDSRSGSSSEDRRDQYRQHRRSGERSPSTRGMNAALRSPSPGKHYDHRDARSRLRSRSREAPERCNSRSPLRHRDPRTRRRSRSRSPNSRHSYFDQGRSRLGRRDSHFREDHDTSHQQRARSPLGGKYRTQDGGIVTYGTSPRDRSLSPYSRRLALTQALNRT